MSKSQDDLFLDIYDKKSLLTRGTSGPFSMIRQTGFRGNFMVDSCRSRLFGEYQYLIFM